MSMGGEVGSGAGIAPHPNPLPKGARRPMVHGVIFSLSLWERAGMRASARTFSPITPPQSPSHQTPPQTLTAARSPSATHQTGG